MSNSKDRRAINKWKAIEKVQYYYRFIEKKTNI